MCLDCLKISLVSFNPCFIGSSFQTFFCSSRHTFSLRFQSLFYWKQLSDLGYHKRLCRSSKVSILVLLEVAFRRPKSSRKIQHPSGFNPCFIGSSFQTRPPTLTVIGSIRFQSLFYWKQLSDTNIVFYLCYVIKQFQSLFYWKQLSDNLTSNAHYL